MEKKFRIKLVRSLIGCTASQKDTVRCLGLRRLLEDAVFRASEASAVVGCFDRATLWTS